jgi:hypothetical protein
MDEREQEIFREMLSAEILASDAEINAVFTLAAELCDDSDPEYCQIRRVYDEDTEAELNIILSGDSYFFEDDTLEPNVKVMLSRADEDGYLFCIVYDQDNKKDNLEVPPEDEMHLVTDVCDDLLKSGSLSPIEKQVVEFYKKALLRQLDEMQISNCDRSLLVSIPVALRNYMLQLYGDRFIVSTEKTITDDSKALTITKYLPIGSWDGTEDELDEVPYVAIAYENGESQVAYALQMDKDGIVEFDTGLLNPPESPVVAEHLDDIIGSGHTDRKREADISRPTSSQVEEIMNVLLGEE